jgi:hypothetical protein
MALQCLHAALRQIVPDLDRLVIARRDEIRTVWTRVEVDTVDTLVVGVHSEVGGGGAERPHLDGAVEAGGGECVRVLGVDGDVHDVVGVTFEDLGV